MNKNKLLSMSASMLCLMSMFYLVSEKIGVSHTIVALGITIMSTYIFVDSLRQQASS